MCVCGGGGGGACKNTVKELIERANTTDYPVIPLQQDQFVGQI